jgi:acetyl esterase/lipase
MIADLSARLLADRLALSRRALLLGSVASTLAVAAPRGALASTAASAPLSPRAVPAKLLPVPDTVSDAMKAAIAAAPPANWDDIPADAAGWRAMQRASGEGAAPVLADICAKLRVSYKPAEIAGVPVFEITPDDMPQANRDRLLVHLHGGGYVLYPGEVGAGEGMLMAGYGRFKVISVDYRMAPDFPFPAALDDSFAVWNALRRDIDPRRMAVFGTSAGGGLTLALMLKAKQENAPLPAAIGLGSPWCDLTGDGDSLQVNAFVDNVLVANSGWVGAAGRLYAGGGDLAHPLISPIYGDFAGLPPAILTSGTRDLLLSDAVRAHRKLRLARVEAALQVFEGLSHAQFLLPFAEETEQAFGEIAEFFDKRMAA